MCRHPIISFLSFYNERSSAPESDLTLCSCRPPCGASSYLGLCSCYLSSRGSDAQRQRASHVTGPWSLTSVIGERPAPQKKIQRGLNGHGNPSQFQPNCFRRRGHTDKDSADRFTKVSTHPPLKSPPTDSSCVGAARLRSRRSCLKAFRPRMHSSSNLPPE